MRIWFVLIMAVGLSACGGRGSSTVAASGGEFSIFDPGSESTSFTSSTASQGALIQFVLTAASGAPTLALYSGTGASTGAGLSLATVNAALAVASTSGTTIPCSNNQVSTVVSGGPNNTANLTVNYYYDAGCTKLWWVGAFSVDHPGPITLSGSYTYYLPSGSVYEYVNPVMIAFGDATGSNYFSVIETVATSATAPGLKSFGYGCSASVPRACTMNSLEHITTIPSSDQGQEVSATVSSSAITFGTLGYSISNGINQLSIIQGSTLPVVNGVGSSSFGNSPSGLAAISNAQVSNLSISVFDSLTYGTASASYDPTLQSLSGTVTQTGHVGNLATFSVSASGSGIITYSSGTTGSIADWFVQ